MTARYRKTPRVGTNPYVRAWEASRPYKVAMGGINRDVGRSYEGLPRRGRQPTKIPDAGFSVMPVRTAAPVPKVPKRRRTSTASQRAQVM